MHVFLCLNAFNLTFTTREVQPWVEYLVHGYLEQTTNLTLVGELLYLIHPPRSHSALRPSLSLHLHHYQDPGGSCPKSYHHWDFVLS